MTKKCFCYSCYEAKPQSEFTKHGDGRWRAFCTECYKKFTHEERKKKQISFVFNSFKHLDMEGI